MRKPPTTTLPAVAPADNPVYTTQVRKYRLITPLFGGGVDPGVADPISTVRATEVRGQLRFWWRACRGGQYATLADLKDAEDALWGAASTAERMRPSEVQVVLTRDAEGQLDVPYEIDGIRSRPRYGSVAPAYGAFPLQPAERDIRPGMELKGVRTDVAFTLQLTFPTACRAEIEAAIWAWETFGGIGARTRRGFGAILCTHVDGAPIPPPRLEELQFAIESGLKMHVLSGPWPADVPHLTLPIQMRIVSGTDPIRAWQGLLGKLKNFRQMRPAGAGNRPGRSLWPEPEAIRSHTGQRLPLHAPLPLQINKFPRAAFGLPIVFHFKDANRRFPKDPRSDPADTTLQGLNHERLASRLILRPIACANNRAAGLTVVLSAPRRPPGGLQLAGAPTNPAVDDRLTATEANSLGLPSTDILFDFLKTL